MTSRREKEESTERLLAFLIEKGGPEQAIEAMVRVMSVMVIMAADSREEAAEAATAIGKDLINHVVKGFDRGRKIKDGLEALAHEMGTRQ